MTKITSKVKFILLFVSFGMAAYGGEKNDTENESPHSYQIVFVKQATPTDEPSTWGFPQIYRMNQDGSDLVNLSNRNRAEGAPNVSYDSKQIVFIADSKLYVMGVDGAGMKLVPNSPHGVSSPKWSRGIRGNFILYGYPYSYANSAIYRINPDGGGLTQLTYPAQNENDDQAVSIDDQYIVFRRSSTNSSYTNRKSELYLKNIWDDSQPALLTIAPSNCELSLPVISHNGATIAFRVWNTMTGKDRIQIAEFTSPNSIIAGHDLKLMTPADMNISGIDFSADDQELIVSLQANDVSGSQTNRKQELFRVSLDGSNQKRLTFNSDMDKYPSVIP